MKTLTRHIITIFLICFSTHIQSQEQKATPPEEEVQILRGPYLQSGTQHSMIIKWRTNIPTSSRVVFGTEYGNLDRDLTDETFKTDHELLLDNLEAHTRYYYSVGNKEQLFIHNDDSYYLVTSPPEDYDEVVHIWATGDFGTGDEIARRVREGYLKFRRGHHTDVWLMLGDIAYYFGKEIEFQKSLFSGTYDYVLRNTVVWPTPGNHDMRTAGSKSQAGPYYDVFTLPKNGEAGGLPSGTEAYYSFNYGDIHFVSLDSEDTPRDAKGEMARWLRDDLEADQHKWKVVVFHHPPYTKGSHDSDRDVDSRGRMKDMRENILPILEKYGVDLVLSGHSHIYERSYLIRGHYGYSDSFNADRMIVRQEDRKRRDRSTFFKRKNNHGTVYVVCGVSGSRPPHGTCDHPAMAVCLMKYHGSFSIEIRDNLLLGVFIDEYGRVKDSFTITKEENERVNEIVGQEMNQQ